MKIIFIVIALFINFANAEIVMVRPELLNSKDQKYTAGDRIELEIKHGLTGDFRAKLPSEIEKGSIEWGNGRILEIKKNQNNEIMIVLTSYSPGDFKIESIPFYEVQNDKEIKFKTEELTIHFEKIEGEKEKDELYEPNLVKYPTWAVAGLGLFGLILLIAILVMIKKYLNKNRKKALEEVLTPYQRYERKRKLIESQDLLNKKNHKKFYFSISELVKQFLSEAYDMNLEDKTSSEMFDVLFEYSRGGVIPAGMVDQFKNCFEEMDLIKYTDKIPGEEAQSLLVRISTLVAAAWKLSQLHEEIERKKRDQAK